MNRLSRRKAIVAKCRACCDGEFRVADCDYTNCVLNSFRTGKGPQDPKARQKAIRAKCLDCMGGCKEVRECLEDNCPFHPYRLGRLDNNSAQRR